ncbi:hypothetical protein PMAYCL1PPCAC_19232 [Pristionchus mayeri]|uniref:K Homology domain-containing protein n=1 Tax=Pristionchus mayeri TaxID=1317129 RepID=A0AAN5CR74_9BILA|nr:hypothetical protein PMAYCL1PPCAC_09649 [Pristionchus mayeri]GMR49037.1 hypothetical protein PMAYCL1PPCAC_19232 [Pristionchus mayeri]
MHWASASDSTSNRLAGRGSDQFIAETERWLHDAIMIVKRETKNNSIVAGGGAIDMELSRHLREQAKTLAGKEQFFWQAFARTFESNFVGLILGARGMTAKQLKQEAECKIMVARRGIDERKEKGEWRGEGV